MSLDLVLFTGLQASGKTSLYRERFATTHVHVSKDLWPNARKKEERQCQLISMHLQAGRSVVVDNTNPTPVERGPIAVIGRGLGARIVSYSFITSVEDALRRNAGREGRSRIADVGIYAVAKRLVLPSEAEGFDQLFEVRLSDDGFRITLRELCADLLATGPGGPS